MVRSAQSASDTTEPEKAAPTMAQPKSASESQTGGSFFAHDPDLTDGSGFGAGAGELFFRAMLAVLFVIVLGVAAIYVSRRLLPKIISSPNRRIRVLETVHLGPKKAVHVIEVGNRRLLVGSTAENITKLADITDNLPDLQAQEGGNS